MICTFCMAKNSNTYKTFCIHQSTPSSFYGKLNDEFGFDFDPCPLGNPENIDGLNIAWGKRCFVNPPYGKEIRKWLEKALNEISIGNSELSVFLLPAYTDVKWFHEIVLINADEVRFIKGRLKFGKNINPAPFASMLAIFKGKDIINARQS